MPFLLAVFSNQEEGLLLQLPAAWVRYYCCCGCSYCCYGCCLICCYCCWWCRLLLLSLQVATATVPAGCCCRCCYGLCCCRLLLQELLQAATSSSAAVWRWKEGVGADRSLGEDGGRVYLSHRKVVLKEKFISFIIQSFIHRLSLDKQGYK